MARYGGRDVRLCRRAYYMEVNCSRKQGNGLIAWLHPFTSDLLVAGRNTRRRAMADLVLTRSLGRITLKGRNQRPLDVDVLILVSLVVLSYCCPL
jgi:hypothetical protein